RFRSAKEFASFRCWDTVSNPRMARAIEGRARTPYQLRPFGGRHWKAGSSQGGWNGSRPESFGISDSLPPGDQGARGDWGISVVGDPQASDSRTRNFRDAQVRGSKGMGREKPEAR